MTQILFVGLEPETVDFSDPVLPPGFNAEKIHAGIGGGVRLPPRNLSLFEALVNAVHKAAPGAAIAFNTRPEDTAEAAARWLKVD